MATSAVALRPSRATAPTAATGSRLTMVRGLLLDTLLPWAVYSAATHWFGLGAAPALMLSSAVPMIDAARSLRRHGSVNPVAMLVSVGIVASIIAMLLGGSAQLLLLRESLVTALVGLACFASLFTRRPLMFFFMRHFVAGNDADKLRYFNEGIARASFLRAARTVTAVWGGAFLLEFAVRAWLVFHCSAAVVLLLSPVLMNGMIGAAIAWNVWYGKRQKAAAEQQAAA